MEKQTYKMENGKDHYHLYVFYSVIYCTKKSCFKSKNYSGGRDCDFERLKWVVNISDNMENSIRLYKIMTVIEQVNEACMKIPINKTFSYKQIIQVRFWFFAQFLCFWVRWLSFCHKTSIFWEYMSEQYYVTQVIILNWKIRD